MNPSGLRKFDKAKIELRDGRIKDKSVWSRVAYQGREPRREFFVRMKGRGYVRIERLDKPYRTSKLATFQVKWKEVDSVRGA